MSRTSQSPEGTTENSPAIYRWGTGVNQDMSPEGTTGFLSSLRDWENHIDVPSHKWLGYCQLSLTGQRRTVMKDQSLGQHYLDDARYTFRYYKALAERAFAQISDEDFFRTIDDESNSIAVNMKHMAGNMFSRWTDFLTTDGEKPERNRDMEFVMLPETTKEDMIAYWEKGWQVTFDAIEPLTSDDLMRTVTIRGQEHTVVQAINRQLAHYAYHVGQIVYVAKHFAAENWQSLTIPKNKSAEVNARFQPRER